MSDTKTKTYLEQFTPAATAEWKEKEMKRLSDEALDLLTRSSYLLHAKKDVELTLKETTDLLPDLEKREKELDEALKNTKGPEKKKLHDERKELVVKLGGIRSKAKRLEGDINGLTDQADNLKTQATERIYRRDYIEKNFPNAILEIEALDPEMKVDKPMNIGKLAA